MGDHKGFEAFLQTWCDENLTSIGESFDAAKHFHKPRADRLWDEAYKAGFGTEVTSLRNRSGGLVTWVKDRYDAEERRRSFGTR